MTHRLYILIAATLIGIAGLMPAAVARDRAWTVLPQGKPISFRPDRAYLLYRTRHVDGGSSWARPVLMRLPSRTGEGDGSQNVDAVVGKPTIKGDRYDFYLVELPPGDYVLYGISWGGDSLVVCNCLGTVGFSLKSGQVTDIGTYLGDQASGKSKVPELAADSGLGPSMYGSYVYIVATLRPAESPAPPGLDMSKTMPADFRVIGPYPNDGAIYINRLAPIPGLLAYGQDGQVLDVRRNVEVPPTQ